MSLNIISYLQQITVQCWVDNGIFFFVSLLLLEWDDNTINPKHNLGGSSALLLAQDTPQ